MSLSYQRISKALGATVTGFQPQLLSNPGALDDMYSALIEHQLLVIPNARLSPAGLQRLGSAFGPVTNDHHAYQSHPDADAVVVLEWGGPNRPDAAEWHADMTYRSSPPFASVLQAEVIPPIGGDTLWASMYSVYDSLSPQLQAELDELEAVHDMGAFRTPAYRAGGLSAMVDALASAGTAVHPVVAVHPATGRRYLNVSESFTRFVVGLSAPESARLLTMLFDAINRPEHHTRLCWQSGTIAIWDNRATQHYAIADYLPHRRVMYRVAVATDRRGLSALDEAQAG